MKGIDLLGKRFGRLVVIGRAGSTPDHYCRWLCKCDCGNEVKVRSQGLRNGSTMSCGCLKRECDKALKASMLKHGLYGSPTYKSWDSMIQRCANPKHKKFHCYGGRGISVCEQWRTFEGFLADMGERPAGTTIDRIDNNGNYEPGNCRWATKAQQSENRRTTKLTQDDVVGIRALRASGKSYRAIASEYGISHHHARQIAIRRVWSHIP